MATALKVRIEEHVGESVDVEVETPAQPTITFDDVMDAHNAGHYEERDDLVMQYCDELGRRTDLAPDVLEQRIDAAMKFLTEFSGVEVEDDEFSEVEDV